jgi:hypothetical protein
MNYVEGSGVFGSSGAVASAWVVGQWHVIVAIQVSVVALIVARCLVRIGYSGKLEHLQLSMCG